MDNAALVAFAGLVAAMSLVPGPDFMFMLTSGIRYRKVAQPVFGLVLGHLLLVICLVVGLGPLVTSSPKVLTLLTLVGAGYLMYMGINVLRTANSSGAQAEVLTAGMGRHELVRRGFGVAALNPKAVLFYLAILPQFASTSAIWPLQVQFTVLGGMFIVGCLAIYAAVGLLSKKIIGARPGASKVITYIAGVVMILLSAGLLVETFGGAA